MIDLSPVEITARILIAFVIIQLITIAIITLSYQLRRWNIAQTGYGSIELQPLSIPENELQIYINGAVLFADMENAIEQAENRIMFETFIWKNDEFGRKFRDLLVRKATEGVEVYVVYDLIGNGFLGRSRIKFPRNLPTLHVARYFSMSRLYHLFLPTRYNVTHRKLLVIDDQRGFIGGYNVGEEYRAKWRDTHIQLAGPSVQDLDHAFIDFWNHHIEPSKPLAYPALHWSSVIDLHRNDPLRRNYPIRSVYLRAIERAQSHIYITNAYFVPDPAFRDALIGAARRGVDIQVILPWESNHLLVDWVARHWFIDYLKAGIKIFGYRSAMIHAKSVTIDGVWTTIGTANLDRLSLWLNHEINVEIYSDAVAEQMESIFISDKTQTQEVTLNSWQSRSFPARLGERILAPLWPFV